MSRQTIAAAFEEYRGWYRRDFVPQLRAKGYEDLERHGWDDPLRGLRKLAGDEVDALETAFGPIPSIYRELLADVGVGVVVCAADEPVPFELLPPGSLQEAHDAALSWLGPADRAQAASDGLVPERMLPIFADQGWGYYAMLTRRDPADDHVVLFDHGHEEGFPFGRPRPLAEFIARFIEAAKRLRPMNPYDDRLP